MSNAVDPQNQSIVPGAVQNAAPEGLERNLPNAVHNTNPAEDQTYKSHATGESIVPETIQKYAPEAVEKALPESVHPTNPQ